MEYTWKIPSKKSCHFIRWNINGLCLFLPHQHNIVASISDALVVDLMKPAQNPGQPILIGIIHNGFHLFFCEEKICLSDPLVRHDKLSCHRRRIPRRKVQEMFHPHHLWQRKRPGSCHGNEILQPLPILKLHNTLNKAPVLLQRMHDIPAERAQTT